MWEKKKRKDGRKAIVVVFLFTLLASGFFYFWPTFSWFWQKISTPLTISEDLSPSEGGKTAVVLTRIRRLVQTLQGEYGVYVYRFQDYQEYGINQDRVFPAASLIKLPVMIALYQEAEAGRIDLEKKYVLKNRDKVGGAGVLIARPAGQVYRYRQLARLMGQYSDNTAFKVIKRVLGEKRLEEKIKKWGMEKTSLATNKTTPREIGVLWQKLYQGQLINKKHQEEILDFLTKTAFEDRIPAGVPEGVRVAHKVGTEKGVFADAGIVFAKKPFVLVIMAQNAHPEEAKKALPQIARIVWEFEVEKKH